MSNSNHDKKGKISEGKKINHMKKATKSRVFNGMENNLFLPDKYWQQDDLHGI